uniref:zinc-binding protein A33-like n=1 Tax=Myxine glutinosa TaxID=7769 RepID=UPI00358FE07A
MSAVLKDALKCHLCSKFFHEPVTLECSHSFCHHCIDGYWSTKVPDTDYTCPTCSRGYPHKPRLTLNMELAAQVKPYTGAAVSTPMQMCEACSVHPASKMCATCDMNYCDKDLQVHKKRNHVIVDLGMCVQELQCREHSEFYKFFCQEDETMVCTICKLMGYHEHHSVITLDQAYENVMKSLHEDTSKRADLIKRVTELEKKYYTRKSELKDLIHQRVQKLDQDREEIIKLVTKITDTKKEELNKQFEEKDSALKKIIFNLNKKKTTLQKDKESMETELRTKEPIIFLLKCKELQQRLKITINGATATADEADITEECCPIDEEDSCTLEGIKCSIWRQLSGQTPTVDENSVHEQLLLSKDLRKVTLTEVSQPYPNQQGRFDSLYHALGAEQLNKERHYWEVDVSQADHCCVGVAAISISRKQKDGACSLGRKSDSWCLEKSNGNLSAWHDGCERPLNVAAIPHRLGLFLDFQKGKLIFCRTDTMMFLHTFQGNFKKQLYPAIELMGSDGSVSFCQM